MMIMLLSASEVADETILIIYVVWIICDSVGYIVVRIGDQSEIEPNAPRQFR